MLRRAQCARGPLPPGLSRMAQGTGFLLWPGGVGWSVGRTLRRALPGDAAWAFRGFAVLCAEVAAGAGRFIAPVELLLTRLPAMATAVERCEELLADLARAVAVSLETGFGVSEAWSVSGSVGNATSGWLPLSVGRTTPSNPGRAMWVVNVNARAPARTTHAATTTLPTQSRTTARLPVSSLKTGLVTDTARQFPRYCPRPNTGPRSC